MKLNPATLDAWVSADFYGRWIIPFADGHARCPAASHGQWGWTRAAARSCLDEAWRMTGVWQARRPFVLDRAPFDHVVVREVSALSRALDAADVTSLRDLAAISRSDQKTSERLQRKIFHSVHEVALLKPTAVPVAMFGAKVLHHYFPTIVPVYDDQWVKKGAMRMPAWRAFEGAHDGWIVDPDPIDADDREFVHFRRWFGGCLVGIDQLSEKMLGGMRATVQRRVGVQKHASWIGSKLDAKIAEWCLLGEASRLGYLRIRTER